MVWSKGSDWESLRREEAAMYPRVWTIHSPRHQPRSSPGVPSSPISELRAQVLVMFRESENGKHLRAQPSLFMEEEADTYISRYFDPCALGQEWEMRSQSSWIREHYQGEFWKSKRLMSPTLFGLPGTSYFPSLSHFPPNCFSPSTQIPRAHLEGEAT